MSTGSRATSSSEDVPFYQDHEQAHGPKPEVPQLKKIGLWQRMLPLLAISLPTIVIGYVFALTESGYRSTATLYRLSKDNRVPLQIVVHLLSAVLAVPWTYALAQTFNLYTRTTIGEKAISLDVLRFWTSTSLTRLDLNLSRRRLILCILICAISLLPNFLWTGSLTPQQTATDRHLEDIVIKNGGNGSWSMLADPEHRCRTTAISLSSPGMFTLCPGTFQSGAILQSAASAVTLDGSERNHSKPDNTGYTYRGRSYGIGASVGWTQSGRPSPSIDSTVLNYTYIETGYMTGVSCSYNQSSMWVITDNLEKYQATAGFPNIFAAQGWLPK
jgi:hypothetical protein